MEAYTARPTFCGSCHIMDRPYRSWSRDVHGSKVGARCVDCHYAPGEQHTIKARFRGLSQLMSYFAGASAAGRRTAHAPGASCVTAECHGNDGFMDAAVKVQSTSFSHRRHLQPAEAVKACEARLAEQRKALLAQMHPDVLALWEKTSGVGGESGPADKALAVKCKEYPAPLRDALIAYLKLREAQRRLGQLVDLSCATCHVIDPTGDKHIATAKDVCYTCHLANRPVHERMGECLTCHQPGSKGVIVHDRHDSGTSIIQARVVMDHKEMLEKAVDCDVCHSGVVSGTGRATRAACRDCHDDDADLKGMDDRTAECVQQMHRSHAPDQRARCRDCHEPISHPLPSPAADSNVLAALSPARAECGSCHPDHHRPQIDMLLGRGGIPAHGEGRPNPMAGVQADCHACHLQPAEDRNGNPVLTVGAAACRACHGEDYARLLDRWKTALTEKTTRCREAMAGLSRQLTSSTRPADAGAQTQIKELMARAQGNLDFAARANGLHNVEYADQLLEQVLSDLKQAEGTLAGKPPPAPTKEIE